MVLILKTWLTLFLQEKFHEFAASLKAATKR
jgi:hypothetical protein